MTEVGGEGGQKSQNWHHVIYSSWLSYVTFLMNKESPLPNSHPSLCAPICPKRSDINWSINTEWRQGIYWLNKPGPSLYLHAPTCRLAMWVVLQGLTRSTSMRTHAYFTMVYHHDKLGLEHKPKNIIRIVQWIYNVAKKMKSSLTTFAWIVE